MQPCCGTRRAAAASCSLRRLRPRALFEAATAVSPVSLEEEALPAEADGEVVELEEESSAFSSTLDEVQLRLPHKLDKFQRRAVKAVLAGKSCVVCAPTGSGKTLIAEAAIVATLAAGKRAFYTTPLKALSNQKLREFSERFGSAAVGLRTGDTSINPDARLVVMTTEILRNMLYRDASDASLVDAGLFVLDEVHYLADADRGTVWEACGGRHARVAAPQAPPQECIIYAPRNVPLLALSATVGNPEDVAGWIAAVHGPCELVTSGWRPVPLSFWFARRGGEERGGLAPLLNRRGDALHWALSEEAVQAGGAATQRWGASGEAGGGARIRRVPPSTESVIRSLQREELLPAIWFMFSRKRCDAAAAQAGDHIDSLVSASERGAIAKELAALQAAVPEAVPPEFVAPLLVGVASHHAGCLPGWKALVERLFQRGLLKLVFATETLAAGIHMPARAVVLSSTAKRDGDGPRALRVSEFFQMAGRAGRRGYDTAGACIVVQSQREGAPEAAALATGAPERLSSRFSTTYGMAANLLRTRSIDEALTVVSASFANYLRRGAAVDAAQRHAQQVQRLASLKASLSPKARDAAAAAAALDKLRGRVVEERRALAALTSQLAGSPDWLLNTPLPVGALLRLVPGGPAAPPPPSGAWGGVATDGNAADAVTTPALAEERTLSAAIVCIDKEAAAGADEWVVTALGADNVWYRVPVSSVVGVAEAWRLGPEATARAPRPRATEWVFRAGAQRAPGGSLSFSAACRVNSALIGVGEGDGMPLPRDAEAGAAVAAARVRVAELEDRVAWFDADARATPSLAKASSKLRAIASLEADTARAEARLTEERTPAGWGEFNACVVALRAGGALLPGDPPQLTRLGEAAAAVRCTNELWAATALLCGALDPLPPHALAGLLASLLSDECVSRPGAGCAYAPSVEATEALAELLPLAERMDALQAESSFVVPVALSPAFVGLVESWARGATWEQVCADTSLDPGDVARLLRRVAEFAASLKDVPFLTSSLRASAKEAASLLSRAPIAED